MQDLAADWKSGESARSVRDKGFGWLKESSQYHEKGHFRYGRDKRSVRPSPTNPVNQSAMMRRCEEEIKGERSPLNPVSRHFCKSSRDRESVKHPSEKA
jgi:hypothetical protein